MAEPEKRWDRPDDWPEIASQVEYEALHRLVTEVESKTAEFEEIGPVAVDQAKRMARALRWRLREWENKQR